MTSLQSWLSRPRTTIRINPTFPWKDWIKLLRRPFSSKADARPRIEVLDRLPLGGKKSLLLISIEKRHLLIGIGEDAAPSLLDIGHRGEVTSKRMARHSRTARRTQRAVYR